MRFPHPILCFKLQKKKHGSIWEIFNNKQQTVLVDLRIRTENLEHVDGDVMWEHDKIISFILRSIRHKVEQI